MKIELLYFRGCPGYEQMLPAVERTAERAGAELHVRAVETPETAHTERFLGSPTLRVDGVDVEPGADERDDFGLKCRVYRSEEGQSGFPPETWIRTALDRAGTVPAEWWTPGGALIDAGRSRADTPPERLPRLARLRSREVRVVLDVYVLVSALISPAGPSCQGPLAGRRRADSWAAFRPAHRLGPWAPRPARR